MNAYRQHRTLPAWLALLSVLFFVLAPVASATRSLITKSIEPAICSVDGAKQPGKSTLPTVFDHGEHCPLCHLSAAPALSFSQSGLPMMATVPPTVPGVPRDCWRSCCSPATPRLPARQPRWASDPSRVGTLYPFHSQGGIDLAQTPLWTHLSARLHAALGGAWRNLL